LCVAKAGKPPSASEAIGRRYPEQDLVVPGNGRRLIKVFARDCPAHLGDPCAICRGELYRYLNSKEPFDGKLIKTWREQRMLLAVMATMRPATYEPFISASDDIASGARYFLWRAIVLALDTDLRQGSIMLDSLSSPHIVATRGISAMDGTQLSSRIGLV
jgi:hypothetical protein